MSIPLLELAGVSKDYRGLRPLRIEQLSVAGHERVALLGLDQPMAEVFVNLVTGTALPDRGDVRVFGRSTAAIVDSDEWLKVVDRFGIVSERAVLLEALTVLQNLAVPFTLDIDPLPPDAADRAARLAGEARLSAADWEKPVAALDGASRARVRLARALALDPALLLLEHPTTAVDREQVVGLAECIRSVAAARGVAVVALTADRVFASAVAGRVLTLDPATGRLNGRGWFGTWLGLE